MLNPCSLPLSRRNLTVILTIIGFTAVATFFGFKYSNVGLRDSLDPLAKQVLSQAGNARAYEAHVATAASFPDRQIHIIGDYSIDRDSQIYAAVSTTTLTYQDIHSAHIFTLENRAIQHDIYTRLKTTSSLIKKTMPQTNGWKHFIDTAIPADFLNIAVPGPVSDNLQLFANEQKYLKFLKTVPSDTATTNQIKQLLFTISDTPPESNSVAQTLWNRIGKNGLVNVWIDEKNMSIVMITFANTTYVSTTTISNMNNVQKVTAPTIHN